MGGAAAAVGVGVAIMTGGIGAGLAAAGIAAYAGGKAELRGGNMADVATAMGGASLAAGVAGNVVPALPALAKAGIGIAGTIGFTVKGVNDVRAAGETFSNPQASTKEKILSGLSVAEDIAGLTSSAVLAYHGLSDLVGVSNIARPTEIKSPDGTNRSVECGGKGSTESGGYYQDSNGRWRRENGRFASKEEVGLVESSTSSTPSSAVLRRNMIAAGQEVPPYSNAAHHIVAGTDPRAAEARKILETYHVDINNEANGVFLPTENGVSDAAYHPSLHTKEYYEAVNELLNEAGSREDVIATLKLIGEALKNGTFIK